MEAIMKKIILIEDLILWREKELKTIMESNT